MESEKERRDQFLEAVAFGAARLLEPGSWHSHAEAVMARLGRAADAARAFLIESLEDADGSRRLLFRVTWAVRGQEIAVDDPRLRGGISVRRANLERLEAELSAGRPIVVDVGRLPDAEQSFPGRLGSRAFAAVPIFANGVYWGLLGFGETRRERTWSLSEIESLKAAAAVFGAAIERERADGALHESKERFRRLASAAFEGIAITEAGQFVDANDQMAKILGCEVTDLVGRRVEEFVAPEDRALVRSHSPAGPRSPTNIARGGRTAPSCRWRSARAPCPYDGRTVRVSAIRDVSERVDAEERQRTSRTTSGTRRSSGGRPSTPSTSASCSPTPRAASCASTAGPWSSPAAAGSRTRWDAGSRTSRRASRGARSSTSTGGSPCAAPPWSTKRATAPPRAPSTSWAAPGSGRRARPPGASSPSAT